MNIEEQQGDVPLPRFGHTTSFVGGARVVLFGGATGDSGRYTITADTYLFDISSNQWARLSPDGAAPSARAAHAAACIDQFQLAIYGGATGGGSLSSDELYLLDLRNVDRPTWMSVPVQGTTPGRRYGHTMVYNKPLLVTFGGNNGQSAENDIWFLNVEQAPFFWTEVTVINTRAPLARVYHSADVCKEGPAAGMMVVFGGRTGENRSLKDIWGLRQHRDGRWDWVEAPTKTGEPPQPRFQHSTVFHGSKLLVIGGRGSDVNKPLPTGVYDTENCEWRFVTPASRFRHSSWGLGPLLFSYGGFNHKSPSAPTNDLQCLDLDRALASSCASADDVDYNEDGRQQSIPVAPSRAPRVAPTTAELGSAPSRIMANEVKVANQVYVSLEKDFTHLVRKVAIEQLEDESRKVSAAGHTLVGTTPGPVQGVHHFVIDQLCQPLEWQPPDPNNDTFILHTHEINELCDGVLEILKQEPMCLRLRAPIKVYGDIHGQYVDLMRLFARYKSPADTEGGDIDAMDYLFLGDYVDRGAFSLETVCLLFALKIRYPRQIHLLRGNHEDPTINAIYGFRDECARRLHEDVDDPNCCWMRFNAVFEWLPCGAIIEDRVLCIHGGIGGSLFKVSEIENLQRPLHVAQVPKNMHEQRITDLLWSDPTDSDAIVGVTMNETRDPDGSGRICKFGPDRVKDFLDDNPPLQMIIRAHECVMDGFERFAGGKLITLFSATDYCGHHKNAGALLFVRRDLTIVPKLIYPVDRSENQQATWDTNVTNMRPPTPPRPVPRARRDA